MVATTTVFIFCLLLTDECRQRMGTGECADVIRDWRLFMTQVSSAFVADPELTQELERRSKPIALGSDRVLFHQGDPPTGVYILRKGEATLTRQFDDEAILSVQVDAGSLLGLPAVIGAKPYSLTAEALEGAELSLVSREDFVDLMQTEPLLSFQVLMVLAEEVRFARESLLPL
jgi:CRP-like cAMP-binding protein